MKYGLALFLAFSYSFAAASPTPNEFLPCHKIAASSLMQCLDEAPGYPNDHCWDTAKRQKDACYKTVQASHQPDMDRIEAAKKAMENLRK